MPKPMTPAERRFWAAAQQRAARVRPALQSEIERAFRRLRAEISEPAIARLIEAGDIDGILDAAFSDVALADAFGGVREQIGRVVTTGAKATMLADATLRGYFNVLAPEVIDAIRSIETKALGTLGDGIRETVRAYVENGLRDGVNPRAMARDLRSIIGLAPNQLEAVQNYEAMLRGGPRAAVYQGALDAGLRDKRFDATLRNAMAGKTKLTDAQIAKMVGRYRERFIAWNAETNARTTALDALREGQRLTWEKAIARGDVNGDNLWKRWIATLDERTRPEHVAAHGIEVRWDELFPVDGGVMTPGLGYVFNCRCVAIYFTRKGKE